MKVAEAPSGTISLRCFLVLFFIVAAVPEPLYVYVREVRENLRLNVEYLNTSKVKQIVSICDARCLRSFGRIKKIIYSSLKYCITPYRVDLHNYFRVETRRGSEIFNASQQVRYTVC